MAEVAYFQTIGRHLDFFYFENHQVKETSEEPEAKVKVSLLSVEMESFDDYIIH